MNEQVDTETVVRRLFAEQGLTPERLGAEMYEVEIRREVRRLEGSPSEPLTTTSPPTSRHRNDEMQPVELSPDALHRWQQRNIKRATRGEIAAADALAPRNDAPPVCANCGGARAVYVDRPGLTYPSVSCWVCVTVAERMALAGVDEAYVGATPDTVLPMPGNEQAIKVLASWTGQSVVIASRAGPSDDPNGTGKTLTACALLSMVLARPGSDGRFLYVADYLNAIKSRFNGGEAEAYETEIAEVPVLVLDDLGAEQRTDWATTMIVGLIHRRVRAGRTTIITTNLPHADAVEREYGRRLADRLTTFTWILVGGKSKRGTALAARLRGLFRLRGPQ